MNAAAQQLNITPPAISHSLKKFENDLNLTLFTRNSKGIKLTPEGKIVANKVKEIVKLLDDLEMTAQQIKSSQISGSPPQLDYLALFSEASIFESQLPSISNKIYKTFPNLDFIIAEQPLDKVLKNISNDPNSFALLLIGNDSIQHILDNYANQIAIKKIQQFPLQLLANSSTKWLSEENRFTAITIDEIKKLPLIAANWISSAQYTFNKIIKQSDDYQSFNYAAVAPTLAVLNMLLDNDIGVCLGIDTPFMNFSSNPRISVPIIDKNNFTIDYCMVYHKSLNPEIVNILTEIVESSYKDSVKYSFNPKQL